MEQEEIKCNVPEEKIWIDLRCVACEKPCNLGMDELAYEEAEYYNDCVRNGGG